MPEDQQAPDVQDVDFAKAILERVHRVRGINPARIERIHEEVRFDDLVSDLTGRTGYKISCPFHGTDSTPSFQIYPGTNSGFCFGCAPPTGYYDHIKFVREFLGLSWYEAIVWIERKYGLPPLSDVLVEDEDSDEQEVTVGFDDLKEAYLAKAAAEVRETRSLDLAESYIDRYFTALRDCEVAKAARKQDYEEAEKIRMRAVRQVAASLGQQEVDRILARKASRGSR